jgi:hypothetical protein
MYDERAWKDENLHESFSDFDFVFLGNSLSSCGSRADNRFPIYRYTFTL